MLWSIFSITALLVTLHLSEALAAAAAAVAAEAECPGNGPFPSEGHLLFPLCPVSAAQSPVGTTLEFFPIFMAFFAFCSSTIPSMADRGFSFHLQVDQVLLAYFNY